MAFVSGIGYGWSSTSLPKLNGEVDMELPYPISIYEESWLTSLLSLGGAISPFLSGFSSERFGRKKTLLLFSIPMLLSNIILSFAKNIQIMYLARFLLGLGIGCVFSIIPIYIGEISEAKNRGRLSLVMAISLCTGTLFSYIIAPFIKITTMALIATIPSICFLIFGFLFLPESPYYLISINDLLTAEQSLRKLRRKMSCDIFIEISNISKMVHEHKNNKINLKSLLNDEIVLKTLLITNILFVFQHCSGITGIMGYLQSIFTAAGTKIPSHISAMVISATQSITIIITSNLIDKLGRKVLIYVSVCGICVSHTLLGLYFYLFDHNFNTTSISWLPLFSLMLYIVSFTCGMGPVPWTLMGELYPHNVKSILSTITTSLCLMMAFFVQQFFPTLIQLLGMWKLLVIMAFLCCWTIFFVRLYVPETKGKTFQQIQEKLQRNK